MNPTVSIIVPVYNAEKYLPRCVDSILNQEYTDFELLLVNDGSKDSSGSICDDYAARDPRVRVIHKENSGVSDTRNTALDQARGTYIQFLDSDDWITPDATKLFVRTAETYHCDMVIADFYRVVGERVSHKGDIDDDVVLTREEFAEHMMENPADFYYGVIWNKFYKREILEKYHLRMDTNVSWCEDFLFNLEYIMHAETFFALNAPVYYYVKTKGSLVAQSATIVNSVRTKLMVFEYYNKFYKHILDEEDYDKNKLQVYRFFLDAATDGAVPPTILPGATKLGEERASVCQEAVSSEGILSDSYRSRKLLERYLETVAIKNGISLDEANLLLHLSHSGGITEKKDLADFAHMSKHRLAITLQKLEARKLIRCEDLPAESSENDGEGLLSGLSGLSGLQMFSSKKKMQVTFLPTVMPMLDELADAQAEFEQTRFAGFTEEELVEYSRLTHKITENIQRVLS